MLSPLEECLTNNYKDRMVAFLKAHPECWEETIQLAVTNKQPYSWRAAWLLNSCIEKNDIRIQLLIPTFIESLNNKTDGHQREILKILLLMELSEEQESTLFDFCIQLWKDIQKKSSIRHIAFRFLQNMVEKYPELKHELELYSDKIYLESLSPGIRQSIIKIFKTS